jgi:hypothetical protein
MRFVRAALLNPDKSVRVAAVNDLILGDGTPVPSVPNGTDSALIGEPTVLITQNNYTEATTFEVNLNGNAQIFLGLNIVSFGGGAMTGCTCLMEFYNADLDVWIPSTEGVVRTANLATHETNFAATGSFVLASRVEPPQFTKARYRFHADGGAADGTTLIRANWWHDGAISNVAEQ